MIFVWIAAALAALYLIFIVGPAIVAFFKVFERKDCPPLDEIDLASTSYAPCAELLLERYARMKAEPSEDVVLTSFDGTELHAMLYARGNGRLAVLAHGYRSAPLNSFCTQASDLLDGGFDVLLIWQRAHGPSGGVRSSLGIWESRDLLSWLAWADERYGEVLVCGVSMGSAAAAYASTEFPASVGAMVLDSGFISPRAQLMSDCAKRHIPGRLVVPIIELIARIFLGIRLDEPTTRYLARTKTPALFIHGEADLSVPFESGKIAYAVCASEKDAYFLPGAGHILCYPAGGEEAKAKLFGFIDKYFQINNLKGESHE
jgi:hypothetical protein